MRQLQCRIVALPLTRTLLCLASRPPYQCPLLTKHSAGHSSHTPLAWLGDIASLEQRISTLEEANRKLAANAQPEEPSRVVDTTFAGRSTTRRFSHVDRFAVERSLGGSSPAIGLLSTFSRLDDEQQTSPSDPRQTSSETLCTADPEETLDKQSQETLFDIYHDKVQCRYPFLQLEKFRHADGRPGQQWAHYFINIILSIGLLLQKDALSGVRQGGLSQVYYRRAVTQYLSHVFAQPNRILHIQAYLLLAMHAIYSPSSERIISIASATMRYCVMTQLHLAEAEPDPVDVASKVESQMRRRIFWSAYSLDRTVGTLFDLPFSIPDSQITSKIFADIDDHELEYRCAESFPDDPSSQQRLTNVSAALHVVYCRQIQSEILNTTLHRDFDKQFDRLSSWRVRVLEKLDHWKALCHRYSVTRYSTFTSREWLHMIYNYSLAMLYQPTRITVAGPAGDWTVKSCTQACLIFRKFQREAPISELWLGLIAQFRCGVALLYCFFATPPHLRSEAYTQRGPSEAVRACSIVLSILAERWPQSKCLRDAFDVLASEVPLFEPLENMEATPQRMGREASETLLTLLKHLEPVVVHRNTLRMIKEMAVTAFPRPLSEDQDNVLQQEEISAGGSTGAENPLTGDIFDPVTPHFSQRGLERLGNEAFDFETLGFPGEFDVGFSFELPDG